MQRVLISFVLGILGIANAVANLSSTVPGFEISLVSEKESVVPGEVLWVGIHQKIPEGFHTYWKNPGTVGLPTSFEWKLPEGMKVGESIWPVPQISKMSIYDIWGYKEEALIITPIYVPDSYTGKTNITIQVGVQFMCCGKQCFPGFKDFSLTMPVQNDIKLKDNLSPFARQFSSVKKQKPKKLKHWDIKIDGDKESKSFKIHVHLKDREKEQLGVRSIYFLPYQRSVSSSKLQNCIATEFGFTIRAFEEEFSPEKVDKLQGMLVFYLDGKETRSPSIFEIDIPIQWKD